jgi:hypothetical protein
MSHVHVKINFSYGIDSWNRCLSVHKRLQIRALASECTLAGSVGGGGEGGRGHARASGTNSWYFFLASLNEKNSPLRENLAPSNYHFSNGQYTSGT